MISFPVAFDKTFHNISYAIHFYSIVDGMITLLPKILLIITMLNNNIKGSPESSHLTFEINVGKRRIRDTTTLKLNDLRVFQIQTCNLIQSRSLTDPPLSEIDLKKWLGFGPPLRNLTYCF